jgi:hypothetical protein
MKALLNLLLFGMISLEILSPFILGYCKGPVKSAKQTTSNTTIKKSSKATALTGINYKDIEPLDEMYSDSKSLTIKDPGFSH